MPNLGGGELIIVLLIVLVPFGGAKLPKLARSLGEAKKEFSDGMKEENASIPPTPAPPPQQQGPLS